MATDPIVIIGAATGGLSALLVLSASVLIWKRAKDLEDRVDLLSKKQNEIRKVESKILAEDPSYEEFEKTVSDIAERLFSITKSRYEMKDVTTYQEIIEKLDRIEDEEDYTDDLRDFFQKIENMKYSEEGLSQAEKALIRQSAYNLIRKVEPDLEGSGDRKQEE